MKASLLSSFNLQFQQAFVASDRGANVLDGKSFPDPRPLLDQK